jgi:hypothetical protein
MTVRIINMMKLKQYSNNKRSSKRKTGMRSRVQRSITEHYIRPITYTAYISFYTTSQLYTFSAGSDVRYIAFNAIFGSSEFTSLAAAFQEYKSVALEVIINRAIDTAGLAPYPALVVACQPNSPTSNPTNTTVVYNDNTLLVPILINRTISKRWNFSGGAGFNSDLWTDTNSGASVGSLYIGSNVLGSASLANIFDVQIRLICAFRGTK